MKLLKYDLDMIFTCSNHRSIFRTLIGYTKLCQANTIFCTSIFFNLKEDFICTSHGHRRLSELLNIWIINNQAEIPLTLWHTDFIYLTGFDIHFALVVEKAGKVSCDSGDLSSDLCVGAKGSIQNKGKGKPTMSYQGKHSLFILGAKLFHDSNVRANSIHR